jgi:hypothetical protein
MNVADVRYALSRAIMGGMVESPARVDAASWGNMRSDEVEDELRRRWPSYQAFWQDVHGDGETLHIAQERFGRDAHVNVRSEVLLTRAQVTRVRITEVQVLSKVGFERTRKVVRLFGMNGAKMGILVHDHSDQISTSLQNGDNTFECMALSVSATRHHGEEPLTDEDIEEDIVDNCEEPLSDKDKEEVIVGDGEEPLHIEDVGEGIFGDEDIEERFVGDGEERKRYRLSCWINALVICRKDAFCYRVGLANIPLKRWLEENAAFETVRLV